MSLDSSIGVRSTNASAWGRRRRSGGGLFIVTKQRVVSYPCATNGGHVEQGCAQTLLALANDGVTGVTDWLR
jgi:hypothetical protein